MSRSSANTMIKDLTQGPVLPLLFRFTLPLFVSNALQAIYNIVDMIVVGNYIGAAGMSAVSIGGDILNLLTFVAIGFSSAGQVIIARKIGSNRRDDIRKTIGTMFSFLLGVSLVISLVCYHLRYRIMDWLNTPSASFAYTMDYLVTCVAGLFFIYGYNIVSAILRGMGDSKRPFVFIAIAAVLNMVLDVLFVKYLHLKVFGAALATVIGQSVSFIVSLIYLYINRISFGFDFRPESFRIDEDAFRNLLSLGIPMAIQSAAVSFSKIVLMAWINLFDVSYSALAGIFNKINTMCSVISHSFVAAGSTMVGQNLSAGKHERVNRILAAIMTTGILLSAGGTALMLLAPEVVYGVFTTDLSVLSIASVLTLPLILNFYGAATRSGAFALINGSGRPKMNLAVALIDGFIARIGLAALLGFAMRLDCLGFWLGDALAGFMPLLIASVFYFSGKWKEESGSIR